MVKSYFALFFAVLLLSGIVFAKSEINIDILENKAYIDYTLPFSSSFEMNLPDFDKLIYIKFLPSDINYLLNDNKLRVNTSMPGVLVLKYQSTSFLDNKGFYDKTLDFDISQTTTININSDKNISMINTLELNNNAYSLEVNEDTTLHILIDKDPFSWQNIAIIIFCFVLIIIIALSLIRNKLKNKEKKEELYLDDNQQKVYDLVKTKKGITQQVIADTLNIRKSHMSKILNKMERNSLIERKKVGKVNKIILAEKKPN